MKKILVIVSLFVFGLSLPVHAAWDQKDVQKLVDKVQAGKGFNDAGEIPSDQVQLVLIRLGDVGYLIDMKAKLCFIKPLSMGSSYILVPCKNVKDGYPLMAPLINWEK